MPVAAIFTHSTPFDQHRLIICRLHLVGRHRIKVNDFVDDLGDRFTIGRVVLEDLRRPRAAVRSLLPTFGWSGEAVHLSSPSPGQDRERMCVKALWLMPPP